MAILTPYISFTNTAREAMSFYHSIFGGELEASSFGDMDPSLKGDVANGVMHAQLRIPGGMNLMAADTPPGMEPASGAMVSITLSGGPDDDAQLSGWFGKLAEGGMVTIPLAVAPWGDKFGMLIDRFGVKWMVNLAGSSA